MKSINEIVPYIDLIPFKVEDTMSSYPIESFVVKYCGSRLTYGVDRSVANFIAESPNVYTALRVLVETLEAVGFKPMSEGDQLAVAYNAGVEALKRASGESV